MAQSTNKINVYLEIGKKRTFAGAIDWPGWCRSGRDEQAALQALYEYGPRYGRVLRTAGLGFQVPTRAAALSVLERLEGTMTTDFGAPNVAPSEDTRPVDGAELERFRTLLKACWRKFDVTVKAAAGKELLKGPRGGGRELEEIVQHVLGADAAYLGRLGWKLNPSDANDLGQVRQAIQSALAWAVRGEGPVRGPRGGLRWGPRYFVRRVAWHVLDHAWEIEDRVTTNS
jgi:hypothetical protein